MKKSQLTIFCVALCAVVISVLVLVLPCGFGYNFGQLLEQLCITVFTGCIFAVPSGFVYFRIQKSEGYETNVRLLDTIVSDLGVLKEDFENYLKLGSLSEETREKIHTSTNKLKESARKLGGNVNDEVFSSKELNLVLSSLYEIFGICQLALKDKTKDDFYLSFNIAYRQIIESVKKYKSISQ